MTRRAWRLRIVLASTAFGGAAGALALRTQLPPAWLLVAAVVAVVLGVVALRGVHHRVDQEKARRTVFYAGEGSAALFVLLTVGLSVVPAWVIGALPDPALQSPAAAVLAAAVASAVHGVLSATTTPTPQPVPDVVRPGPSIG
ncbi:hypothetical protein ACIPJU_08390 [Micrococcus endophyticus]|uniref:hypothetical protein n=2 Tax=Micrococcus TaxID=1269 RepID=UPI00382E1A4F